MATDTASDHPGPGVDALRKELASLLMAQHQDQRAVRDLQVAIRARAKLIDNLSAQLDDLDG